MPAKRSPSSTGPRAKLLCIDDEPQMLKCLSQSLRGRGYDTLTTNDPEKGIEILRENRDIALLLLDVKMPRKSGFDVYADLMKSRRLPVLFVTAYPRSFDAKNNNVAEMWTREFAEGDTDILYKPFDLPTLFEKVENLVGTAGR